MKWHERRAYELIIMTTAKRPWKYEQIRLITSMSNRLRTKNK